MIHHNDLHSMIKILVGCFFSFFMVMTHTYSQQPSKHDAKAALGRYLFYDADLSKDGSMSCATCHRQKHAFTDGNATHPGINDDEGVFNVPTLGNVGLLKNLNWTNQHVTSLAQHAIIPLIRTDPVEMGMKGAEQELIRRLSNNACYVKMFNNAFPKEQHKITIATITQALASFEKTLVTFDTIWDKHHNTNTALPIEMQAGEKLFFGKGQCVTCHIPPLFTDQKYYKINKTVTVPIRTPPLRNIELTAPYLHDGSIPTIQNVIRYHDFKETKLPNLSNKEINDITVFLNSLTDHKFIKNPQFSIPPEDCPLH